MAEIAAAAPAARAPMQERLNPFEIGSEALKALVLFGGCGHARDLDPSIIDLVKARTLQLTADEYGQAQCRRIADRNPSLADKVAVLQDWYTSRDFSPRERAALLWAEDIVYATHRGVPDRSYAEASREFPPDELWAIAVTVTSMCAWGRIVQTFHLKESIG